MPRVDIVTWSAVGGIRTVGLREFDHRAVLCCGLRKVEGSGEYFVVSSCIACGAKRPSHRVPHDQRSRKSQFSRPVFECLHHDRHRGDAGFLDRSCYMSDRHVADRSDGDEDHEVDVLVME